MARKEANQIAMLVLGLNFCMFMIVCGVAGWAIDRAMEHAVITGLEIPLPNPVWAVYFPMGNAATGFFVLFALIAGAVGAVSCISGVHCMLKGSHESLASAASTATTAWALTLLAMGFAWKEVHFEGRNSRLQTLEAFIVILSITQFIYVALLHHNLPSK